MTKKTLGVSENEIFSRAKKAFYLNEKQSQMTDMELKEYIVTSNNANISSTIVMIENLFDNLNSELQEHFIKLTHLYDNPNEYKKLVLVIMEELEELIEKRAITFEFLEDDDFSKQITNFLIYSICKNQFTNNINLEPDNYFINFHFIYKYILDHKNLSLFNRLTELEDIALQKYAQNSSFKEIHDFLLMENEDITEEDTKNIIMYRIPRKLGVDNCFQAALTYNYKMYEEEKNEILLI